MKSNKLLIMLLLTTLGLSLLAGCGGNAAESESAAAESTPVAEDASEARDEDTGNNSEVSQEEETPEEDPLYTELSDWGFEFSSGAGGWGTELNVNPDGSFEGFFVDSDMGNTAPDYPDGTVYRCDFTGQFTGYRQKTPYIYELDFDDPEYEKTPDTEEIVGNTRYIYSTPYGLEGTNTLILYLPGTPVKELPEDYLSWAFVSNGTYIKTTYDDYGKYYQSSPVGLPFCGLFNTNGNLGFYSVNTSDKNKKFVINTARFPGLTSDRAQLNDDGTYYYVDSDPLGMYRVTNICLAYDDGPAMWQSTAEFAEYALQKLPRELRPRDPEDVYIVDKDHLDNILMGKYVFLTGEDSVYASWNTGSNEDMMYNIARITSSSGRTYIYVISRDPESEIMTGEAANFYLGSLSFTGSPENLSSAGKEKADSMVPAYVKPNDGKSILAQRLVWITQDDTDLLEEYGIDPDDIVNDYALGNLDDDYSEYDLAPDCPIYMQFPENIFDSLTDAEGFAALAKGYDDWDDWGRLMQLYLDKNGKVLFMYEPYTP